ncbi:olfactory receptor 5V1-like [Eublepharis macularius]|uniref:Olfactory receptor 5V1-like n=1 Tax=Eublepharis macularius TaxID=481883 RepID=A0AA97JUI6_EUBMA|nr:olfactory receptor 5V1-like [Eublepharis macularius]
MAAENHTQAKEFIFLGFSGLPANPTFLFVLFLAAYMAIVVGNLMILILVLADSCLHSPMYFFLSHLSCLDICLSTVVIPKMLVNFLHQQNTISYRQCLAQTFFLIGFAGCEPTLLAVMAYDRYAAICRPLHYSLLMSKRVCVQLASATWVWGFLDSAIHTALAANLSFCGVNQIPHIFCDVPPLLKIACSDTRVNELATHITSLFVGLVPILIIILSYIYILASVLRIRSGGDRRKAFSTCASHLIVLFLCLGNAFLNYNRPSAGYSLEIDTLISTMFCIVNPMLNPLIYSLRNNEVKEALRKLLNCKWTRTCTNAHSSFQGGWGNEVWCSCCHA